MSYFRRFFGHLKTILTHKKWVFRLMCKMGYPVRGFFHDMSKFSPVEFFEGVRYWNGSRSPINVAKERKGYSNAWFHHKGRNKHHYEYWIDKIDDGGVPCKMPFECVVELICDWLAAAITYEGSNPGKVFETEYDWWQMKGVKAKIFPRTKDMISKILWNFKEYYTNYVKTDGMSEKRAEKKAIETVCSFVKGWKHEYNNRNDFDY